MKSSILIAAALALALPARGDAQMHEHAHAAAAALTPAESATLDAQVQAVRAATARYRDHANAVRDGYRLFGQEGALMGEHWYRKDLVGLPLDLAHPSTLQYATIGGRKVLVGVAYSVYRRPGDPEPEGFAGSGDHWHTHDIARLALATTEERPFLRWLVERRIARGTLGPGDGRTLLTMVHAWVWLPNPDGMFAMQHRALPYLRAGLPAAWANGAGDDAAQGIQLLAPGGCAGEVARTDRMARLGRGESRGVTQACERIAARLRGEVARHHDAVSANAAAARAWADYGAARDRALTAEQRARVRRIESAAVEHEMAGM